MAEGLRDEPERRNQPGSRQPAGDCRGENPAGQPRGPFAGRPMKEPGEGEHAAHDRHVEDGLGVAPHEQREERRDQQQVVPPGAALVRHHQGIEDEGQEGRRVADRPVEPEQQEPSEPESQAAEERRSVGEPLPPQQQEEEDEGDQHAQSGCDPDRGVERERQGEKDQRLERLRLRIGEQRHPRSGEIIPEGPDPAADLPAHLRLKRNDLGHQVELQEIALRRLPRVLRLHHPRQDVSGKKHLPQEQRRPEEDHEEQGEHPPDPRRHRFVPAPEGAVEEEGEEGEIEAGEGSGE